MNIVDSTLNGAPGYGFDPRTVDQRVAAEHTQSLHAEDATMKSELFCTVTMASVTVVGVPLFAARRTPVKSCASFVTNFSNVADLPDDPEVLRKVFHFLFHVDY